MNIQEVLKTVENEVKTRFANEGTGHDWYHIDRVRRMALEIQKNEGGKPEVIELAALLHDISDHKFNGGDFDKGAEVSEHILKQLNVDATIIKCVVEIVKNVSYKGSGVADNMESIEGKIVQDADRIDAIGAIGIARTFAYGGSIGQPVYDPAILPKSQQSKESYVNDRTHTVNHFYEKLLLLENRMHTDAGKKIAKKRTLFMKEYLTQFYEEWG